MIIKTVHNGLLLAFLACHIATFNKCFSQQLINKIKLQFKHITYKASLPRQDLKAGYILKIPYMILSTLYDLPS